MVSMTSFIDYMRELAEMQKSGTGYLIPNYIQDALVEDRVDFFKDTGQVIIVRIKGRDDFITIRKMGVMLDGQVTT